MKTILFAWELGRGLGHLMAIRRIAARLKTHGFRFVAVVNNMQAASLLQGMFSDIIPAPPWPIDVRPASPCGSSATLGDILSSAGLADPVAVHKLLIAWDGIFKRIHPDLVIADFSPLAALAACDRIPLVLIGNGYTLPPHEMKRFPLLHRFSPPVSDEEQTLTAVNTAMLQFGRAPLSALPCLFSGDAHLVQTFPLLDPYDMQRIEPVDGPIFDPIPTPRSVNADSIFVYLSGGYMPHPAIVEALRPYARRLRLYAPKLPGEHAEELRCAGAQIDNEPAPLASALPTARLLVHHGGSGVAAEALAAGVPQLILSAQIEQDLNGEALQRAGVAKFIRIYEPGAKISSDLIGAMIADDALAARVTEQGEWHRAYAARHDALLICERTCLRLLAN